MAARWRSWRNELRRTGLDTSRVYHGDWSSESGYQAGQRLVADGVPTAVFAANDQMAELVIRESTAPPRRRRSTR